MKIKRFEARSFTAAMLKVKKELGKDAVIISTENINGRVCITAAKDYDLEEKRIERSYEKVIPKHQSVHEESYAQQLAAAVSDDIPKPSSGYTKKRVNKTRPKEQEIPSLGDLNNTIELDYLKDEIKRQKEQHKKQESFFLNELGMLRESLSGLLRETVSKDCSLPVAYTPYLKAAIEAGIEEELMINVLKNLDIIDDEVFHDEKTSEKTLRQIFNTFIKTRDMLSDIDEYGGIYAFVGPTGVGKTTTAVKIATSLVLMRERDDIALISLDFMRADGSEQLKRFARILGVPFYQFNSAEQYQSEIDKVSSNYPIILVDTAGVSPLNKSSLEFLEKVCKNNYTTSMLHIPVATQYEQAISIYDVFREAVSVCDVIYTKEDEAFRNGLIGSLSITRKVTAAFLTNGQQIPEDLVRIKKPADLTEFVFWRKYDNL